MKMTLKNSTPIHARRKIHGQVHDHKIFLFKSDRVIGLVEYNATWKDSPGPDCFKLFDLKGQLLDSSATYRHMKSQLIPKHRRALSDAAREKRERMTVQSIRRIVTEKLCQKRQQGKGRGR